MNKELTLEHLSGYLPYGLKAEMLDYKSDYVGRQYDVIIGVHQWSKNGDWCLLTDGGSKPSFNHIKPILRPLTDLTKEIEVNGEKFVPIIELAKISEKRFSKLIECEENESGYFVGFIGTDEQRFSFVYFHKTKSFLLHSSITTSIGNSVYPANQLEMFNKLYEWHFDIHNLIEQGLAIDYNTLNK